MRERERERERGWVGVLRWYCGYCYSGYDDEMMNVKIVFHAAECKIKELKDM